MKYHTCTSNSSSDCRSNLRPSGIVNTQKLNFGGHNHSAALRFGKSTRIARNPMIAPTICATRNNETDDGAIPANEFENIRPTVIAGLAKLVEDVKK